MARAQDAAKALQYLLLLFIVTSAWIAAGAVASYPVGPNQLLGTCLDSAWVRQMEHERGVSSQERDSSGRLVHPFMQQAVRYPRFMVDDPRTASEKAYSDDCMQDGGVFDGANQDAGGTTRGESNGTLVLDMLEWETHRLSTMVLAIIAEEVVGYKVSISSGGLGVDVTERMSSVKSGVCTPTHLNAEVWTSTSELRPYFNESYKVGGVGYNGRSGLYVSHSLVMDGTSATPPYFPDFWRHYKLSDDLISTFSAVSFKANSAYNPPASSFCQDGTMGCMDNCQKTRACTLREDDGKDCLVVAMISPYYDRGYLQAAFSNLEIPAYFCFIGYGGLDQYASDAATSGDPVLFYYYEPDPFHVKHKGIFDRVFLPQADPERVQLNTGGFGENGYGEKTDNPVDVDFPAEPLMKYAASIVEDLPIGSVFTKFTLSDANINELLSEFIAASEDANTSQPDFHGACNWVKQNYDIWSDWVEPLPLCTLEEHVATRIIGCEAGSSVRQIEFKWKSPSPENPSLPNSCDGGLPALPTTIITSRSCDWIRYNFRQSGWTDSKPTCDSSFYDFTVSPCDSTGYQTVQNHWKLPRADNSRVSVECGVSLPPSSNVKCEFLVK